MTDATAGFAHAPAPPDARETILDRDRLVTIGRTIALVVGFILIQRALWPAPAGVLLQGVIIGGLTAMIAVGIALIYRANRIVNFAQGDLGAVPTVLSVMLIGSAGLPYLAALPLGLILAVGLGAIVEFTVIRRFEKAPRLILTVATLGLAQVMGGLSVVIPTLLHNSFPDWFPAESAPTRFPSPFPFRFEIDPVIFSGNDLLAVAGVVITISALGIFLRYTRLGTAMRASAESADRAMLLGVPVKRVQTIVWVIATVLAFLAMFLRAGVIGLPVGSVLGPAIIIRALAACVFGRMENFTAIVGAAIGLGVLEQAVQWNSNGSGLLAPILFVVVVGVLLLQRRGALQRTDADSSWQAVSDVRGIPAQLAHLPEVRAVRYGFAVLVAALALFLPLFMPESRTNLLAVILVFAMLAVSLVVLTGWAGQISLGQVAFLGIGAAVGGAVSSRLGWDILIAVLVAGLVGAVLAVVLGLPALRVQGLLLAVVTLALAQAVALWLLDANTMGWWLPRGRIDRDPLLGVIPIKSETQYYYFTLACLVLILLMVRSVRRSRLGRVILGVRENERGAQAYGINVVRAKLTAFALSGFIAAVAGAVFVHHQQSLGIQPYATEESLAVFTMVVIGGLGSLPGAILGAVYVIGARYFLPTEVAFFTGGFGLLLVLMALPGGLGSLLYQGRDGYLRWVANRRKIIVPSLNADATDLDTIERTRVRDMAAFAELADLMEATGRTNAAAAASRAEEVTPNGAAGGQPPSRPDAPVAEEEPAGVDAAPPPVGAQTGTQRQEGGA
jgi:branched-chain amino acid transport system permease protein